MPEHPAPVRAPAAPIDADAWAEKYVRLLLEAEQGRMDVAPEPVRAVR